MNRDTPWTPAEVVTLRTQWDAGAAASAIGRTLRRSSNSVIHKAHRLGLASRTSPILPAVATAPRAQPLPPGARTLPLLPSEMAEKRNRPEWFRAAQ